MAPRIPAREPADAEVRAWIDVEPGGPSFAAPSEAPALVMNGVRGWLRASGQVLLLGAEGSISATAEPAERRGRVRLYLPPGTEPPAVPILSLMTLVSSLLLGRLCHTLVHSGAIQGPDERAWMLIGSTFSGKSTTCITLIRGGWNYLADDHVVLGRDGAGGVRVDGWPRPFNLDDGYARGSSAGVRSRVDPEGYGPGHWVGSAPLGGLLFPGVEAEQPTALERISPADALSRMLRQSPWLFADAGAAAGVLRLLQSAAGLPAYHLRLGRDCYGDSARLQQVLGPLMQSASV